LYASGGYDAVRYCGAVAIGKIILDCANPRRLAEFWTEALGYRQASAAEPFVVLTPREGTDGPWFLLQRVPEPKISKNRMHVDLRSGDIEEDAKRLEAIGATRLVDRPRRLGSVSWIVMADPEGNEFCVASD
jgi:predicted enzyme related to lactoylglutathione lyase